MAGLEKADGGRGLSTYPREWGAPPGSQFSEERALWVLSNVAKPGAHAQRALDRVRELRMHDLRERIQNLLAKREQ